ncbi:poly(A) RNA polymerase, mitochondrial [Nilaparvata lugens]|uniref:poly(A) RNA polymerase, mitochondrial n=1 Tax=Nilaparvata lugens TaxID=108931 RepID=UPI00193EBF40|nr:poly(A) RNA polymerase, mitochondrial [Nilaparvata lugens]
MVLTKSSKIFRTILRSNSSVSNRARRSYGIEKQCFRSYASKTTSNISNFNSEPFIQFGKVLEKRQCEAKRSILVQVHSKLSCIQLTDYCSTYGQILNLFHYQLPNMNNFIIVEFERENSVDELIARSTHFDKHQIIPVRSQFLWFKENLKEKKNRNPSPKSLENLPLTISQEVLPPDPKHIYAMLNSSNDIPDQMIKLFDALCLDEIGIRMRFLTAQQIQRSLTGLFPAAVAVPYGSTVNSYGKKGCDLDIHVQLDQSTEEDCNGHLIFHAKSTLATSRAQQQRSVDMLGDLVQLLLPGCNHVRKILNARVPILRYKQELTGTECDISVTNMSSVYMSELLYIYGSFDWRVRPLVFTVRFWAKSLNLTSSSPGPWITNFSLTLLVLFI